MTITVYESERQQKFIDFWQPIKSTVLNGVGQLTAVSYGPSIDEFLVWWSNLEESNPIVVATAYRKYLSERGLKPATVNKKLSAIRKLFETAAVYGIGKTGWPFTFEVAQAVKGVKNIPQHGDLYGTRLSEEQLKTLCYAPDGETCLGRRDRAVLALLAGCGLRRSEVCNLTWGHLRRDGNIWIIANLVGKHGRRRSVGIPPWAYNLICAYSQPGKDAERIIVSSNRHGQKRESITTQSIYRIVTEFSMKCFGFSITPHDLRRSHARLLRDKGAAIEDIRDDLGHSSSVVTERYIGKPGNPENLTNLWEGFDDEALV